MALSLSIEAYLSEIQSEALERIYENSPSLRPKDNFPDWEGWRRLKLKATGVIGAFTTIENWDSPDLRNDLGSLDANTQSRSETEKATFNWLNAEIIALAENVKKASSLEEMFSFSESLARRLELLDYVDIPEVRDRFIKDFRRENASLGGKAKNEQTNKIKSLAWSLFEDQHKKTNALMSAKEIRIFLEAHLIGDDLEKAKGISIRTLEGWRTQFTKRIKNIK